MADQNMSISGPVEIKDDSQERVALDLAIQISYDEPADKRDRQYWLTLYRQCYKATRGATLEMILRPE